MKEGFYYQWIKIGCYQRIGKSKQTVGCYAFKEIVKSKLEVNFKWEDFDYDKSVF